MDGKNPCDWTPLVHGYLAIDTKPISTPRQEVTHFIGRPERESLTVAVSAHIEDLGNVSLHFKLFARGLGPVQEIGRIMIWATHVAACSVIEVENPLETLQTFCPHVKRAQDKVVSLHIEARTAQLAVPYGIEEELLDLGGGHMVAQLQAIRQSIKARNGTLGFHLILSGDPDTKDSVDQLANIFSLPAKFFRQSTNAASCEAPAYDLYSIPGLADFSTDSAALRVLHFSTALQHQFYHVAGECTEKLICFRCGHQDDVASISGFTPTNSDHDEDVFVGL